MDERNRNDTVVKVVGLFVVGIVALKYLDVMSKQLPKK